MIEKIIEDAVPNDSYSPYRLSRLLRILVLIGRYSSASEVVRSALRLLEAEEKKIKALRLALEEGENSEIVEDFDPTAHLESLHRKHL